MKQLMLTGLSNEQDFSTGETKFVLVFNGGDLRIDISEQAAEQVIRKMYGEEAGQKVAAIADTEDEDANTKESQNGHNFDDDERVKDEDGIDQL